MKKMSTVQFMNERKVGLIVRAFATRPEDVADRALMVQNLVNKALEAKVNDKRFIKRVDVLIWANQEEYPGQADCLGLAPALKKIFNGRKNIQINEIRSGDLFCSILNFGIAKQTRAGCDYSVIASAEANPYWSSDVPEQMVEAACSGGLAIGIALNELTQSVKEGRIANTMAMWHNQSLISVGGFSLQAKKPKDDREARYVKGVDQNNVERYYHIGGVEEIIPLSHMVDNFGQCIVPIESEHADLKYITPNEQNDPEGYKRHHSKFGTKTERQLAHIISINRDFSHIRSGVMSK